MTTASRIREILTDLERVRENLLALSDDIWLGIDHNNSEALERGVRFKLAYNEKMDAFSRLASELSTLVQQFTDVRIEAGPEEANGARDTAANERIIRELDMREPHTLAEDFRYKRPYGYVLLGRAFKDLVTWRGMYEQVCAQLRERDPARFAALPADPAFTSNRGNRYFARDPDQLRVAARVAKNVYAEVNLSANSMRDAIARLLNAFGVPESGMTVYLRQDRNAE